jgi:hypothetical protein
MRLNAWEALTHHFQEPRVSERELLEAGLVSEREGGGVLRPLPQPHHVPHPR